ncbi:major_cap_HK97, phage major capsid protein, HK97 family [uncultured Caudovirales phage]|uniref:Major_cap_HK97, phage major capsid protein, HK97 family n=1 Tax=uncultured Caudovirales phage TaxID=2100421 RepID=A0A6J5P394_9CAUD|nr:major_cap_HK97, phage major capsid protein, HK97 family [uncultured Caudovirales phage]
MSEEIIKNQPGTSGDLGGTQPGTAQAQGAFASGSDAGENVAGNYANGGALGNIEAASFGSTSGVNAVNPSGDTGSGILRPEQARRFIDYVWDATVLAKDGRRVTMKANTMELEKVNVGERVIRAAAQGLGEYTNAGATFSKVELTTKKIRLDWEVSSEALEDNIEGAALEDHIVRLMTNAFGNDIEDLAINGTGTGGAFTSIMNGFVNQVTANTSASHESVANVVANAWTTNVLQDIILAMPRKYRALKNNLKFYAGTDVFQGIVKNNGTLADAIAEAFVNKGPGTEANRQAYLDGNAQTFGGARTTRVLGIDVQEVPYYPAGYVDLTFPANRVWGFQRDITVNREYKPKKDTVEYTVFVRFGIQWEELDAVAYADAAGE